MNANAKDQNSHSKKVKQSAKTELSIVMGRNIRLLREQHKMSQHDIAAHLGVSYQQVQKYETGFNRISVENLFTLKELFQVPYDYFLYGSDLLKKKHSKPEDIALNSYLLRSVKKINGKKERKKIVKIVDIFCS